MYIHIMNSACHAAAEDRRRVRAADGRQPSIIIMIIIINVVNINIIITIYCSHSISIYIYIYDIIV